MVKLIVHADDFGLSERINEGILRAHRNGVLTSASIMASGVAFEHAVRLCREAPTLDVGIHLTLVEERPLLEPYLVASLLGTADRFHRDVTVFANRYFRRMLRLSEVRSELDAQIRKVLSQGIRITHLDSHQHVHMLPEILRITVALAHHYGIPSVRFPSEAIHTYMLRDKGSASRVAQLLGLKFFCHLGRHAPVRHTDHFAGFFFGGRLNRENLLTVIEHLPHTGTCELMCHPGHGDPASRYAQWGYDWSEELNALVDPEVRDTIRRRGVDLISYREMALV